MFIKELHCQSYGPFTHQQISFWSENKADQKVTVIIGENGAGKTKILEAIMTLLSWFVARIKSEKNTGSPIQDLHIKNAFPFAILKMVLRDQDEDISCQLVKVRKGNRAKAESSLKPLTHLANYYAQKLTDAPARASLPLIGFYPTARYVFEFPKRFKKKHTFAQIDGYDAALSKGIDFRLFYEWFRDIEDVRNEHKISFDEIAPYLDTPRLIHHLRETQKEIIFNELIDFLDKERLEKDNPALFARIERKDEVLNDPQYLAVVRALDVFMGNYKNLRVERKPRMRMLIDKDNETFDLSQLSQGELSLLALVTDISRRLAIMNPALPNPLDGEGIILIDEVDLHLHPLWQKTIIRKLRSTFPNCQFILTTHSPLVVSDADNITVLRLANGEITPLKYVYGKDVEQVLLEDMGTTARNDDLQERIDNMLDAVLEGNASKAKKLLENLHLELPADHTDLVKARILLHQQAIKKN